MKISRQLTDEAVLNELGGRLAGVRLDRNLTQAELAEQAGVSMRTISRLESGSVATQLSSLVRVCRVLDLIDRFDLIVPEPVSSPIEQLKLQGRKRRRASPKQKTKAPPKKWQWGDEA
jgi:transcriptional regulator with XRE-family HTH domain